MTGRVRKTPPLQDPQGWATQNLRKSGYPPAKSKTRTLKNEGCGTREFAIEDAALPFAFARGKKGRRYI